MASIRAPSMGMAPITSPVRRLLSPREAIAVPKAPMGPERAARPKLISPMTPERPMRMSKIR